MKSVIVVLQLKGKEYSFLSNIATANLNILNMTISFSWKPIR